MNTDRVTGDGDFPVTPGPKGMHQRARIQGIKGSLMVSFTLPFYEKKNLSLHVQLFYWQWAKLILLDWRKTHFSRKKVTTTHE